MKSRLRTVAVRVAIWFLSAVARVHWRRAPLVVILVKLLSTERFGIVQYRPVDLKLSSRRSCKQRFVLFGYELR
eukprot:COSAG02_NODE_966_length_15587_cov_19.602376_13_plen_74_part_00